MSIHNVCGCTSEDCRVNGCLMKRQRLSLEPQQGKGMNWPKNGGPAFPFGQISEVTGQPVNGFYDPGMSLRDWFAGLAMQGLLAAQIHGFNDRPANGPFARMAYEMADAMLKAREEI